MPTQDLISESFEATSGQGYDMGDGWWSEVGSPDPDSTGHTFSGYGSQCLKIIKNGSSAQDINHGFTSAVDLVYCEFRLYVESHSLPNGYYTWVIIDYDADWHNRMGVVVENDGGTFNLYIGPGYNGGGSDWSYYRAISTGVEYRIRWKYDVTNLIIKAWLDDDLVVDLTPTSMYTTCKYFYVGDGGTDSICTFYMDGLYCSTLGFPDETGAIEINVGEE